MAELGLNVFQVFQNELITRETNRSTLGLSFRLHIIETKVNNAQAAARNSRVWKLHHSVALIKGLRPSSRRAAKKREEKLLQQQGADRHRDTKDPTKLIRDDEVWEVAEWFPRTVLEFKELQFSPHRIRDLLEFYDVPVYTLDCRLIDIHPDDELRDVTRNIETCMEELAMSWGLDWQKINGLILPAAHAIQSPMPQRPGGVRV